MPPREVLLDTNALLLPHQSRIDIFAELERLGFGKPLVVKGVLRELESIAATGSPRDKTAARIGLELATTRCEILPGEGAVDDLLVKVAVERGSAVATNDKGLKRRLKKVGVALVYPRKRVLEMAGVEL
jgi:rRNA-processing protein FCF1